MTNTKKKIGYTVLSAILMIAIVLMIFMPITKAQAAETTVGTANYIGKTYYSKFDIKAEGNMINDNLLMVSAASFKIFMLGTAFYSNIFTTFAYDINFTLSKPNMASKFHNVKFTAYLPSDVLAKRYDVFGAGSLDGTGEYVLSWSGTIKSNATANISGSKTINVV